MASDHDVVVSRILQKKTALGVGFQGRVAAGILQLVQVGLRVEVVVEVDDQARLGVGRVRSGYKGSAIGRTAEAPSGQRQGRNFDGGVGAGAV